MKYLFVFIFLAGISGTGYSAVDTTNQTLDKADSLYSNFEEEAALERYREFLQEKPEHYRSLWRTGYLYARIGNRSDEKEKRKRYFNHAVDYAERALEVDSSKVHSNFVMAVAMGRKAMISGARERVAKSKTVKHYADKAYSIDPDHAGTNHLLGRWHAKITDLNFAERMAAKYLFGGVPEASEQKALKYMERAVELKSKAILYRYDLAEMYVRLGEEDKAAKILEKSVDLKPRIPRDDELLEKSRELLKEVT